MKYPAWNATKYDTGIREAWYTESDKEDIAYIRFFKHYRRADTIVSWSHASGGIHDYHEDEQLFTLEGKEKARKTWAALNPVGMDTLYKGKHYAFFRDPIVEAEYIKQIGTLCDDGEELARHLNAPFSDAEFIKGETPCERD